MSNTIIRPQSREEWLKARESGIGSSEVATIVGLNPWETPYQLWRRKVGIDPPKDETFAMKAGHYLEDAVAQFWHDETGRDIIKSSAGDWLIRDNERPFLQVSPDRTYWLTGMSRNNVNKGILECKTTQKSIDADDLPKHWFVQVQYQLGVAGLGQGSLAWLCSGREFGYKDLAFVEDFYGWLVEEVEKFWTDHILGKVEPAAVNVSDVLLMYNKHTDGKSIEVSEEVLASWKELKEVRKELDALEDRKEELENKIKLAFGDAEAITFGGNTLATWKAPKASMKFDYKAYQKDHADLCKPYLTEQIGARRFLIK
jgi:putative phage-type endonuclease